MVADDGPNAGTGSLEHMTGKPTPGSTSALPMMPVTDAALLPAGVVVHELSTHTDERGEKAVVQLWGMS